MANPTCDKQACGESAELPWREVPGLQPRPDLLLHVVLLLLATGVLGTAFALQTHGDEQVLLPLVNVPLPPICGFKRMTGLDCPGCGLTRCFISLVHGDLAVAWELNPAGLLIFALVAFQIPYRAIQIWRLRSGLPELRLGAVGTCSVCVVAILLLVQWGVLTVQRLG